MIAEKIKNLRKQNNWTQEDLAAKLGVKQPQLNRWETGKTLPALDALKKLSKLFGVSIDTMVFDEKDIKNLKIKDKTILAQLEQFPKLNDEEKETVLKMINALAERKNM